MIAAAAGGADRDRDAYFQREVAPSMAARWADRLKLVVGAASSTDADFTLATSYRFGGTVRVDFTVPVDGMFNRERIAAHHRARDAPCRRARSPI